MNKDKIKINKQKLYDLNNEFSKCKLIDKKRILAEIKIRLVLSKIYNNEPLEKQDLIILNNYRLGLLYYNESFGVTTKLSIEYGKKHQLLLNNLTHYDDDEKKELQNAINIYTNELESIYKKSLKLIKKSK